jgi:Putative abortive phage resistance protein AbiGi, antitoxin
MSLSSNCVIHLTASFEGLLSILKNNFFVKYCGEKFECGDLSAGARVPMVSFCDIPLSEIKDHIEKYGEYGIGLSKEWAKRKGLNPVLYFEQSSLVAKGVGTLYSELTADDAKAHSDKVIDAALDLLRFTKNYEGVLTREGKSKHYRFSDEREWRFVPPFYACPKAALSFDEDQKDALDNNGSQITLEFEPNDIKYIIISGDSEIEAVINCLKMKNASFPHRDVERLTTRILTTEQIRQDV